MATVEYRIEKIIENDGDKKYIKEDRINRKEDKKKKKKRKNYKYKMVIIKWLDE